MAFEIGVWVAEDEFVSLCGPTNDEENTASQHGDEWIMSGSGRIVDRTTSSLHQEGRRCLSSLSSQWSTDHSPSLSLHEKRDARVFTCSSLAALASRRPRRAASWGGS